MVVEAFGVHNVRGVEGLPPQEVATYMDALATAASVRRPICTIPDIYIYIYIGKVNLKTR